MNKKIKKEIIVIEGPSGVGKDSVISMLIKKYPETYEKIISITTRPKRKGESEGAPYYFVNRDQFEEMLHKKEIFEFTLRHGTYRGMSKSHIDNILNSNKIAIKDADLVGVRALKKLYPGKVLTFFLTSPKSVIEQRLLNRGDNKKDIIARLADYDNYVKNKSHFDYVLENNTTLDEITDKIHNIIIQHIN